MNKYQYSTKKTYFQKARFFRKNGSNEYAYCIEPFRFFNDNGLYTPTLTPNNLTNEQKERIEKIAYFGYGYANHHEEKWYAITQFMIWQTADNSGDYYFTDTLNGNRVNYYQNEINEINNLIANYDKLPSFNNQEFIIIEDNSLVITDQNNVISNYISNDIKITNNTIKIENLKEGNYTYNFERTANIYQKPIIFYQSPTSQNLMQTGNISSKKANFKVKVLTTKIDIIKLDKDTNSTTPQSSGKLDGAIYGLYNKNMELIEKLIIKNNKASIENIPFGIYYLKELSPGTGYTLDKNTYKINLTKEETKINLKLTNEIIKKKIIINKQFGEKTSFQAEKNIVFEIYDTNNKLIMTIITDDNGYVEFSLPFGEYTIVQKNSTKGYNKVAPFKIVVENNKEELIELKDYKIPVPNTKTNYNPLIIILLKLLLIFI